VTLGQETAPLLARSGNVELLDFDVIAGNDLGGDGGPGSLLLLHGFDEDKGALKGLGSHLCPPGAEAVYPTLRGHGSSPRPPWGYSPWDVATDIQRIGDRLPVDLNVVGFSYGALIGLLAALILGPERVRSVVVLDQSFERNDSYVEFDEWLEASFLQWHFDHRHVLDAITVLGIPVLIVVAERSDVVGEAERERLQARAGVEYRSLDTDHCGLIADLDRLLPVLQAFYTRVGREREESS
jgi:hypothetical protein